MADLRLSGLTKMYGSTVAADGVDLYIADREFVTLLGPSGSGKTTVLRMVAGYVEPTAGTLAIGGRDMLDVPPERRDIGMVFQSYALFPHMTVEKNVAFGLERRRVPGAEVRKRVLEVLELVRLTGLEGRYPRQLSGGQQQRVALARALVIRPSLLLLDEPLSNLDAKLRGEVRLEIRRLQQELGITTLLVTHDQEEALTVSDRIAVMQHGRVQQVASPAEIYHQPANRFVADFVGRMNFLPAQPAGAQGHFSLFRLGSGEIVRALGEQDVTGDALLAVRPEAIRLESVTQGSNLNVVRGQVVHRVFLGELTELGVRTADGAIVTVRTAASPSASLAEGTAVSLGWDPSDTRVLPAS